MFWFYNSISVVVAKVDFMQVQSRTNQISNVGFNSRDNVEVAKVLVNADDVQLKQIAEMMNYNEDNQKKKSSRLNMAFMTIPVLDTLSRGVFFPKFIKNNKNEIIGFAKPTLSSRLGNAGSGAMFWAGCFGVVGAYNLIKNSVNSHSETLKKFDRENPFTSLMLDVCAIGAGLLGIHVGANKISKTYPKEIAELKKPFENMAKSIDKTKLNTKTLPNILSKAVKFALKRPKTTYALAFPLIHPIITGFGIYVLTSLHNSHRDVKNTKENYAELKRQQFEAAKYLANKRSVQKDVLSQIQPKLASDLDVLMTYSTRPVVEDY